MTPVITELSTVECVVRGITGPTTTTRRVLSIGRAGKTCSDTCADRTEKRTSQYWKQAENKITRLREKAAFSLLDHGEISAKVAENLHLAASCRVAAAFRSVSSAFNAASFFFHSAA